MKWFYVFWFFFCSGWGYLMSRSPYSITPNPILMILVGILLCGLLVFFSLIACRTSPEKARLKIELKPYDLPLGIFQITFVTAILTSFWGVVFGCLLPACDLRLPLKNLIGFLVGWFVVVLTCRVYRSIFQR